jgi:hypothetical protein
MKPTRIGALVLLATGAQISPMLAMDQKVTLPKDLFSKLTSKNFKDSKAALLTGVRAAVDGKLRPGLAMDASMKGVAKVFDAFEKMNAEEMDKPAETEEAKDAEVEPVPEEKPKAYDAEPLKAFLKEKGMGEDDIAKVCDMMPKNGLAGDEDDDDDDAEKKAKEKAAADKAAKDKAAKDGETMTKTAMDEALAKTRAEVAKEVRETERGIRAALHDVKPWVGELSPTLAFDSASDVHRKALEMLGVKDAKTLHPDALMPILSAQPKPGARPSETNREQLGMDADTLSKAIKIAPGLEHIQTVL